MSTVPERLEWDSAFFGLPIARLEARELASEDLAAALDWCRAQRIRCLYLRSDADDVLTLRSAAAHGCRFVDVRVTLDGELDALAPAARQASIRAARAADAPALRAIAAYNHTNTRFYADGGFARERCDELYATWIEKSLGGWAEHVLVAEHEGLPAAYLTIHVRPEERGEIGLVGVAREAQGRGLGRALLGAALAWMRARGLRRVSVVTQGRNIAAQRLYQSAGLRSAALEYWHHRWLEPA